MHFSWVAFFYSFLIDMHKQKIPLNCFTESLMALEKIKSTKGVVRLPVHVT